MPRFSLTFPGFATSTAYKTGLLIHADGTGERAEVLEIIGSGAGATAPADTEHQAALQRVDATTAGTSTAQTPEELDVQGAASAMTGAVNFSAEPTTYQGKEIILFGFNQRGGMRWAVPRGLGVQIYNAISAAVKAGLKIKSHQAGAVDLSMIWEEP